MAQNRLARRVALITGASRGIGAAVAKRFAAEGAHVVLVARTVGGLEEVDDAVRAAGASATLVPLDLRDLDRIDPLGPALYERFKRLDILVGNAGMLGTLGPLSHHDAKLWDDVIKVNLTANWRLIRTLEPLLKRSDAGRAIFVTSGAAHMAQAYWGAYSASKAALEMMIKTWAAELERTKVRVNLLSPGIVRTAMRAAAFPGEDPARLRPPESITDAFVDLAAPDCTRNGEIVTGY
ncbi:MAG TPA: SDR family NAD(P)-dependent oxidoreductase [Alphaproteobacteria bacterium]|nr:SDR family NAD(P)-dependent oxidoreductase [Alphaproteobacteria bacterium]